MKISKLKKIRKAILIHLDKTEWAWSRAISDLLCQVDAKIQGEE